MSDEEKLFIALLGEEADNNELFTMLEIVALLHEIGAEYRGNLDRELVPA